MIALAVGQLGVGTHVLSSLNYARLSRREIIEGDMNVN